MIQFRSSLLFKKIRKSLRRNANLGTLIAIIALLISARGCYTSDEALEYAKNKDIAERSPSILLQVDSDLLHFKLDKEYAQLERVFLVFPDSIKFHTGVVQGSRLHISLAPMERSVWSFFEAHGAASVNDLQFIRVPIIIDFEASVDKTSRMYREEHVLYFEIMDDEHDKHHARYDDNDFLWPLPHPRIIEDKDKIEVMEYVNKRFADFASYDLQKRL